MKFFQGSPEKKLKAARTSRDSVRERLSRAEDEITRLGAEAERLAVAGDDAALDDAERRRCAAAMRRDTLRAVLSTAEQTVRDYEDELAKAADQKMRVETAGEIDAMKSELLAREASFATASHLLETISARIAVFMLDAAPLQHFAAGARTEVGPAVSMIVGMLDAHRKAVLNGSASAVLPKPVPVTSVPPTKRAVTDRVYLYQNLKWRDPDTGDVRTALKYSTADVPCALTATAIERGWADHSRSERARTTASMQGNGFGLWASPEDCYDLDSGTSPEEDREVGHGSTGTATDRVGARRVGAEWFGESVSGTASLTQAAR